jgi:hypothetical protein
MGGACSPPGRMRNVCKTLTGKPEGKRPLGKPKCRWEDIRLDLKKRLGVCRLDSSG